MTGLVSATLALALGALASSQDAETPTISAETIPLPATITNPSWKEPPVVDESDYPKLAAQLDLAANVLVECEVDEQGIPKCRSVETTVVGMGFEQAAVTIAERGRLNPRRVNGTAVPAKIAVRLPFVPQEPEDLPVELWTGPEPSAAQLLAGLVGAQSMAGNPALQGQIDWGLEQLSPEKAHIFRQWIAEMYVGPANVQLMGRAIAMVLAQRGVLTLPAETPPDWADWVNDMERAHASLSPLKANTAPLRERFCARYGCPED